MCNKRHFPISCRTWWIDWVHSKRHCGEKEVSTSALGHNFFQTESGGQGLIIVVLIGLQQRNLDRK